MRLISFPDVLDDSAVWEGRPPITVQVPFASDGILWPEKGRILDQAVDEAMSKERP